MLNFRSMQTKDKCLLSASLKDTLLSLCQPLIPAIWMKFIYLSPWIGSGHFRGIRPESLCFGFGPALAALPLVGLVASPQGGILSSPQNFNLVCLGCFAVGAEEPKPRLNMRDKRPANRLSLARGENEATANRHCPFLSMNQGFSPLQGQAASKQWCYPELWKSSCSDVLFRTLSSWDLWQRGP